MTDCDRLNIVYQDQWLVAINKPAGLLVHRSPIDRYETRFAVQTLRDQLGRLVYPVHRLDKPTSGLLLFALDPQTARNLADQFSHGHVEKRYLAIVRGHCPDALDIDHPLRDEVDSQGQRITDGISRDALTSVSCLRRWELPLAVDRYPQARYSLAQLRPLTGRHRQLRRHLKHVAHPIIGDVRYGKGVHNRFFREHFGVARLLLAAVELEIDHPISAQRLRIRCPLAEDFERAITCLTECEASAA